MKILEIINTDILPLRVADSSAEALEAMNEYKVDTLPIVDHTTRKLIGMVSRDRLSDDESGKPGLFSLRTRQPATASADQHVFEVAKMMKHDDIKMLPVVDENNTFLGVILRNDLARVISDMLNVSETGAVITIQQEAKDFTLSEIVRIIESEGAKILGIAVQPHDKLNDYFRISVKVNLTDLTRVVASLNRYDFVITQESGSDDDVSEYEDRADEFMRFLDI